MDRFKALKEHDGDEAGAERQEEFRGKLVAFQNLYGFLGRILPFSAPDLGTLYTYGRMLRRKLPCPEDSGPLDPVDGVTADLMRDDGLRQAAQANDRANFAVPFREALDDVLVTRHEKHADLISKLFADQTPGDFFRGWMLGQVYSKLHNADVYQGGRAGA